MNKLKRNRKEVRARKGMQFRAESLKKLEEQRTEKIKEMQNLVKDAEKEERAFTEEEQTKFGKFEKGNCRN